MTAKCALAKALLDGKTLNVKNCFEMIGLTNCSREISRMIEQPFGVTITKITRSGTSRYKQAVTWMDYRLAITNENLPGIAKMKEYVNKQITAITPKTDAYVKTLKQLNLL